MAGPLHPLPVPDKRFNLVVIDFIGPLPKDDGYDAIMTMTDCFGADIQIIPCTTDITAENLAYLFFDKWYCKNSCPKEIISDRNKLFISKFWKALMKLTGIKHKMFTSYHLQTDESSECSNKTIIQCLCFHVERNQKGWAKALPKVRFDIMNTINTSTGYLPFVLKTGHLPRLIPPIIELVDNTGQETVSLEVEAAQVFVEEMEEQTLAARDNLLAAKICQAHAANKD